MTLPPWCGYPNCVPDDGAWNTPDPIIWWFVMPPCAYLWALWAALIIASVINTKPDTMKEGNS